MALGRGELDAVRTVPEVPEAPIDSTREREDTWVLPWVVVVITYYIIVSQLFYLISPPP